MLRRPPWQLTAFALVVIVALSVVSFLRQNIDIVSASTPAPKNAASKYKNNTASRTTTETQTSANSERGHPAFAKSLRGTAHDGRLRSDERGNLIVERGIRDLFDYYLTTLGEHDIDAIRQQLVALFNRQLPPAAAQQAMLLLDRYLAYRQLSGELQHHYPAVNEENVFAIVAEYFQQRDALRNQLFDRDAVDAFFSADQDNEQSALRKLQPLAGETTEASASIGDMTNRPDSYSQYREQLRKTKNKEGSAEATDALRTRLFGREAADRLAVLDQRRDDWSARLANYREQKQQLLAAATHAGIDPSAQLTQLQQSQFNDREILRVQALDRLDTQPDIMAGAH